MIKQHGTLYRPVIPAGLPLVQDIAGRVFYYVNGSGPILVSLGGQPASLLRPGQGIGPFLDPDMFSRIEITDPAGQRMPISFWAGFQPFIDNRQDQVEARTVFVPVADEGDYVAGVLAASGSIDLLGTPTEELYRRKAVQIVNLDPAVELHLCDAADQVGFAVRAGESVSQPVSGFLRITNPSASPVACRLSEVWWTL